MSRKVINVVTAGSSTANIIDISPIFNSLVDGDNELTKEQIYAIFGII